MMNASRIAEELAAATELLSGERGAEASLASALKKLSRLQEEARKRAATAETALEQAFALAEEARRELDSLLASLDSDSDALERKEERLFELRALARKYATTPDGFPAVLAEFLAQREALDGRRRLAEKRRRRRSRPRTGNIWLPRAFCRRTAPPPPASWKRR